MKLMICLIICLMVPSDDLNQVGYSHLNVSTKSFLFKTRSDAVIFVTIYRSYGSCRSSEFNIQQKQPLTPTPTIRFARTSSMILSLIDCHHPYKTWCQRHLPDLDEFPIQDIASTISGRALYYRKTQRLQCLCRAYHNCLNPLQASSH